MSKTIVAPVVRQGRLARFLRIERQAVDRLMQAALQHPQPRPVSNARVVQFARIARGRLT
ncbi:MAG: hypothetical protein MUD11_16825 [Rhodobacteraceae bacterium]|jgi:hypothetical protein|nr:hypothetical protein [Paracoccaceae bacterium]